jgi:Fe-S cluster biosynthesis and repair protein YggX/rhodanese-related sulfurtransferase
MDELKRVSASEAKGLLDREGYILIDVRSTPEFVSDHPSGAYNIPFLHKQPFGMVANPDFPKVIEAAFPDRATKIITCCSMGARSLRAAQELGNLGYKDVLVIRGGFDGEQDEAGKIVVPGWKAEGLPTESGEAHGRAYAQLYAKITPQHAASAPSPKIDQGAHMNRFADPRRVVVCTKLGKPLPGLKRRPMGGPLGERIYNEISADAWEQWVEHSKLLINEYRLNPADAKAQELLLKQCEEFLFGSQAMTPKEFVPEKK